MTSKWEPYVVLSRLPSSSHSRGDRGVRVLRLEGDFYAHLADAQATAKHIEETSRKVTFIAQVLGDDLGKRIKELEDEKVEFLAYAGCSSFPEVVGGWTRWHTMHRLRGMNWMHGGKRRRHDHREMDCSPVRCVSQDGPTVPQGGKQQVCKRCILQGGFALERRP